MHKSIYSIHDMEAKMYHEPMTFDGDVTAKRFFTSVINDPNTFVGKFPSEHCLEKIGTYDNETGKVMPMTTNEIIMLGEKAVKKDEIAK